MTNKNEVRTNETSRFKTILVSFLAIIFAFSLMVPTQAIAVTTQASLDDSNIAQDISIEQDVCDDVMLMLQEDNSTQNNLVENENGYVVEDIADNANTAENQMISVFSEAQLSLNISYDAPLSCNTPMTFTLSASGGSGNYKYYQNFIMVKVDGYYQDDADWTRKKYTTENTFDYVFVAPGNYRMRVYVMDMESNQTASKTIDFDVVDSSAKTVDQEVSAIVSEVNAKNFGSDYAKAVYVHDLIAARAEYDYSLLYDGPSGVLLRGKGTCESYHRAFSMILAKLGIPCERAEGNGHVWSCAKLDGKWTQIDLTWDDSISATGSNAFLSHVYFGLTDELMKQAHSEHVANPDRPCNDLSNNYLVRTGIIKQWTDLVKANIDTEASNWIKTWGNTPEISISVEAAYNYHPTVYEIVYPVAASVLQVNGGWTFPNASGRNVSVNFVRTDTTSGFYDVKATCRHATASKWEGSGGGHWRVCSLCNQQIGASIDHEYGSWVTTKAATTTSQGEQKRTCSVCGISQTQSIPKLSTPPINNGNSNNSGSSSSSSGASNNNNNNINTNNNASTKPETTNSGGPIFSTAKHAGWMMATNRKWYHFKNAKASCTTGWLNLAGTWYYLDPSDYGAMKTGRYKVGNAWYISDASGAMHANRWVKTPEGWYYATGSGALKTGWLYSGGAWYYLDPNKAGLMKTGFYSDGHADYYSNSSGAMRTGWIKDSGKWYFASGSGALARNWVYVGGAWYWLKSNHVMAENEWVSTDGKEYYLTGSGAMKTGWLLKDGSWYLLNASGAKVKGWAHVGGVWYWLDSTSGKMATGWLDVGGKTYYLNSSGAMLTGHHNIGGKSYHFDASGALIGKR